ncbi:hypothetical protein LP316_06565 [Thalassotalea sp. LPB0316]|uniref:hypothetical protein n=1 Tax=Thalassotalea sp. LPB0316 TaxID=2769490 RepID=UPI001865EFF5|nr:hypothetical protein [Thalassotalea sp. LPB0316]QOL26949.1 hypothetical protein LP316_06565 [Thalassotalea sp. LPB0316]
MLNVNKKLWSFIIGLMMSVSFVWLVAFANSLPIPSFLASTPASLTVYYSEIVTIFLSIVFTYTMIILMRQILGLCPSEHPFWLLLPVCIFILGLFVANHVLLTTLLCAALPALILLSLRYWRQRFNQRRIFS